MQIIGKNEWVSLPTLSIDKSLAKIDTGSFYSVLDVESYDIKDEMVVFHFRLDSGELKKCQHPLLKIHEVKTSIGTVEARPMIQLPVLFGSKIHDMIATLTNRKSLSCRILIGRQVLEKQYLVDVSRCYALGVNSD